MPNDATQVRRRDFGAQGARGKMEGVFHGVMAVDDGAAAVGRCDYEVGACRGVRRCKRSRSEGKIAGPKVEGSCAVH